MIAYRAFHRLWASITLVTLIVRLEPASGQLTESDIYDLAVRHGGDSAIPLRELSAADRKSLIAYTYRKMSEPDSDRRHYERFLVKLGDEAAIERFANGLTVSDHFSDVRELFEKSGSPKAAEVLIPYLMLPEKYEEFGGDVPHVPLSFLTAAAIPLVLGNSPAFNSEVIQWAQRINHPNGHITFPEVREVMRDWWRANERFFKERNYKAVQPGREPRVIPPPTVAEWNPPVEPSPPPLEPAPVESATPTASQPPAAPPSRDSSWLGFAIIGGCAALLAVALSIGATRRRS